MPSNKYIIELYQIYGVDLKKTLKRILKYDVSLYRNIVISLEYMINNVYEVSYNKVLNSQWVISYDKENKTVDVIDHSNAQTLLDVWLDDKNLPKRLPGGDKISNVKTFDQLIVIMPYFDPYYLLELAAYALNTKDYRGIEVIRDGEVIIKDFSEFEMSSYTEISLEEFKEKRNSLKELLKRL